jgi:hypothetical protein
MKNILLKPSILIFFPKQRYKKSGMPQGDLAPAASKKLLFV